MRYSSPYPRKLRFKWYQLVERSGLTVKDVCKLYDVPRKTYYKWYDIDHGLTSNEKRGRREDRKTKLTAEVKQFVEKEKRVTNAGPKRMTFAVKRKFDLKVSSTIIYRFYKRKHLIRKPQRKLPWYQPMKEKLVITESGQGVQMDVKYVYESGKRRYQFSVFDPYTQLYHFTIFKTRESKNAIVAFLNAQNYFGFPIISVQTDNGSEFRGCFHDFLTRRKIDHYFIPKKSPWWNAHVEHIHKTVDEEYYHNPYRTWKNVYAWLEYYNNERLHLSLNGLTPREKLAESVTH